MKKIVVILGLLISLLAVVWFVGKPIYVQKRHEKVAAFVEEFQNKVNQDILISNGNEVWHEKEAFIYLNAGGKGNALQNCFEKLMPNGNQMGQYENHEIEHLHLFYPKPRSSELEGVKVLVLKENRYQINWLNLEKKQTIEHGEVYFKDSSYKELFTLNDFVKDKEAFRKVLNATINQRNWSKEKVRKTLTPFEKDDWSSIPFSYQDSNLVLSEAISIPVASFFGAVQSKYLKGKDLKDYQVYLKKNQANLKRVAMTFDDGPNPSTTPRVLDILKQYDAKATFFTIGQKVAGQEAILMRAIAEGHEVENHTWSHPNLTKLSLAEIQKEVAMTNDAIEKATGKKPTLIRPPYGATNETVASATGLREIMWTVDTLDWQSHSTPAIMAKVKAQLAPGGIILMHDIHETSVQALPSVFEYVKSQGYEIVTVSELYGY